MAGGAARDEPAEGNRFGELVGRSASMRTLFGEAAALAASGARVVLTGEAGTGKNALARALHRASPHSAGPFVVCDCGTLPAVLADELFGRADGATAGRAGALELAQAGTILLDDVAELPLPLQAPLHNALATRTFSRLASQRALPLEARVLAASRRKLSSEVERGKFLPELHAQLAQAELAIAPLRERREDIPLLAQSLLEGLDEGRGVTLAPEALDALALHDWPGNVRELRNVLERFLYALRAGGGQARRLGAVLLSGGPAVDVGPSPAAGSFEPGLSYREERARFEAAFERRYVAWLLERHDGNISAGARAAEMDRKYLYKLARKHGLKPAP